MSTLASCHGEVLFCCNKILFCLKFYYSRIKKSVLFIFLFSVMILLGSRGFKVADYLKLRSTYNRGNIEDLLHNF
jgi:hypothetical protein